MDQTIKKMVLCHTVSRIILNNQVAKSHYDIYIKNNWKYNYPLLPYLPSNKITLYKSVVLVPSFHATFFFYFIVLSWNISPILQLFISLDLSTIIQEDWVTLQRKSFAYETQK